MVYKKYIMKNGKLYGPYIYSSKRVDGKVVSEYHGAGRKNYKNVFWISLGVFLLLGVFYFLFFNNSSGITGKATLGINAVYSEGETLDGNLNLVLKQGEFVPASSKIVFENSGGNYEFELDEILNEKTEQGTFYVSGKEISGTGEGYGIEGERINYPEVEFVLLIYEEESSEEPEGSSGTSEEPEEVVEEPEANESEVEEVEEVNETVEEGETEEVVEEPEKTTEEETSEEVVEESEEVLEGETEEAVEVEEAEPEEVVEEIEEVNEVSEEPSEPVVESAEESTEPAEQAEPTPTITGGVVRGFFRLTGQVSLNLNSEITGKTSKDNSFSYNLGEGETAEIKPKSVKINGEEVKDNFVSLKIEGDEAIVSTDYSEKSSGFGKDYLGDKEKKISIDLNELNMSFEEGELKVKLVYEGEEIVSLNTFLEEGEVSNESVEEIPGLNETILNETIELNETNVTVNKTYENETISDVGNFLTQEEREILIKNFGNLSISTTKSEIFKNKIIVGYSLGDYEIEFSYDSSLDKEVLEVLMEADRIKWLKDIAKSLSYEKTNSEGISDYVSNYSF